MNGSTALLVAVLLLLAVAVIRFELFCLRDIAQTPYTRVFPREAWIVITIVSIPLGGLLYLYAGRPR
jgi:hypothetical protein